MTASLRRPAIAALLATVSGCLGFSSAYRPATSPCLSLIIVDGGTRYVHDGVTYRSLADAVGGSETAAGLVRRSRRRGQVAEALDWIGFVVLTVGAARILLTREYDGTDTAIYASAPVFILTGQWLGASAWRDSLDAQIAFDNEKCR